jgi:mRNA export factor
MSGEFPLLVTAHSEMVIHYWDLRKIFSKQFEPQGILSSPLKFATTSICCFGDAKGFAIGSIEGRCGIKYVNLDTNSTTSADDFCFKSHRVDDDPKSSYAKPSQVYSVNGLTFNKKFNTFASYGQDGCYFFWNKDNKSKLKSTKPGPSPVTAADYHETG